jgi:hypothetical protein
MNDHDYIQLEVLYGAHNYRPLDDVLNRGKGVWVWDVEGNRCRKGRNRIYFMIFLRKALV